MDSNDSHDRDHVGKKISWDEATIAEHDRFRGTREKIFEPNTPYHLSTSEHSSEGENLDLSNSERSNYQMYKGDIAGDSIIQQVSFRLTQIQSTLNENLNSKLDFKERRRRHYDEFHRLKVENPKLDE